MRTNKHQACCYALTLAVFALSACQPQPEGDTDGKAAVPAEDRIAPDPAAGSNPESRPQAPAPKPAGAQPLPQDLFFEAALNGDTAKVRDALAAGTAADHVDNDGRTALMLAAFNGHNEIVRALVEAGAPIDARDQLNRTALMYACTGTDAGTVRFLLVHKADVNLADSHEQWTPLMFAAAEGNGEIVRILLDAGANPAALDVDAESAAMFARSKGFPQVAEMIEAAVKRR